MPAAVTVAAFVTLVTEGRYLEAIERFYTDDASMQENSSAPRVGRATLIDHERRALASVQAIKTLRAQVVAIAGDSVVIHWVFAITDSQGVTDTLDELAWQEWRGEKILRERFYYDSAWRKA